MSWRSVAVIDPGQIRAARALLDISQGQLAQLAGVGIATIKRIEGAADVLHVTAGILLRIQTALEAQGIAFVPEDQSGGSGVRRGKPQPASRGRKMRSAP